MDSSEQPRTDPVGSCPDCGVAVQPGQRRCTNCGASVERRRRLPRRTPLVAALTVAALAGGAVVVAQAEVTAQATKDAAAPPDPAAAPVQVAGNPLPAAERATSTAPRPPKVELPPTPEPQVTIPSLESDVVGDAAQQRSEPRSPDGENLPSDGEADKDDLESPKKLKIRRATNYDPFLRAGAEFGKPKAAIDKRKRTVWDVNIPADGDDIGVGLVLDLGSTVRVSSLRIQTPTPGFGAVILRADAEEIPATPLDSTWKRAAEVKRVADDVVVPLGDEPEWARYLLIFLGPPVSPENTRVAIGNLEVLP